MEVSGKPLNLNKGLARLQSAPGSFRNEIDSCWVLCCWSCSPYFCHYIDPYNMVPPLNLWDWSNTAGVMKVPDLAQFGRELPGCRRKRLFAPLVVYCPEDITLSSYLSPTLYSVAFHKILIWRYSEVHFSDRNEWTSKLRLCEMGGRLVYIYMYVCKIVFRIIAD